MTDLIKIFAIIPFGFLFSCFIFFITSNLPLKSRYSHKDFRREFSICNLIRISIFLFLSLFFSLVIVCFTQFKDIVPKDSSVPINPVDDFWAKLQEFNNSPTFLFFFSSALIFTVFTILYIASQNKNKKVALKNLDANAEDNGFIHPIYEAAEHDKGLIIETVDNTIYKGMCLYLTLDRDSTSTEKYVCFLVFEKLFYDKNKRENISIYKNHDLYEEIKNAKDGNQIIPNLKNTPKTYYKEVDFSKYFEIYKNHSVIFKLSDIKTISFF